MLDTHGQKILQPLLSAIARLCQRLGVSADTLSLTGLILGLIAALLVACGLA